MTESSTPPPTPQSTTVRPSDERALKTVAVIVPIYNDWAPFRKLIDDLALAFKNQRFEIQIIAVDDCSTDNPPRAFPRTPPVSRIERLELVSNVGHQRAIAVGLAYLTELSHIDLVAVMDGDGEDRPEDLVRLVQLAVEKPHTIVVAQRSRRSESLIFLSYYGVYRTMFSVLAGHSIDFGNFCVFPFEFAGKLSSKPELWNHFAATLLRSRFPLLKVSTTRAKRFEGRSKMNFVGLVAHGLGAISIFSDYVFIRVLVASTAVFVMCMLGATCALIIRLFTDLAIPGWTTVVLGFLLLISIQVVTLPLWMAFMLLNGRASFQQSPRDFAARLIRSRQSLLLEA